jgi:hypothetical protein
MKTVRRWLPVALLLTLGACGPAIQSGARRAPGAQLEIGRTFVFDDEFDRAHGDPRLEGNRFFEARLHEAIEWELALRGIHRTDSSDPDLRVHHHLSLTDRQWEEEIRQEGGSSRFETFTAEEGSVMVHVLDAATGREVWAGWAQADVDVALGDPERMRTWVYAVVGEMFESWPQAERLVEP